MWTTLAIVAAIMAWPVYIRVVGIIHWRESDIPAPFAEEYYLSTGQISRRWAALEASGRGYYWQAFRKFPKLEDCLTDPSTLSGTPILDWRAFESDEQLKVCIFHLARHLGSPEAMENWFKQENFKVSQFVWDWGDTTAPRIDYHISAVAVVHGYDEFFRFFSPLSSQTIATIILPKSLYAYEDGGVPFRIDVVFRAEENSSPREIRTQVGKNLK